MASDGLVIRLRCHSRNLELTEVVTFCFSVVVEHSASYGFAVRPYPVKGQLRYSNRPRRFLCWSSTTERI